MNSEKLFQVVGFVLQNNNGKMDYYNLIKECYIADRRSIAKKGYSITGDEYLCMNRGPVLKGLYSFIKNKSDDVCMQSKWNSYFQVDEDHKIFIINDSLKHDYLSKFDERILSEVCKEFQGYSYKQMKEYAHTKGTFPEWCFVPKGEEKPLPLASIISAVGISKEEIDCLISEQKSFEREAALFNLS